MAGGAFRGLVRLLPSLVRLVATLVGDRRVNPRAKLALAAAAAYLASPIDLLPDVIPFLGYLDDVLLVAIVLDGVLNHVDRAVVAEHWPGDAESLERASRLAARVSAWVPPRWKARIGAP